jgi:hypothetical protein
MSQTGLSLPKWVVCDCSLVPPIATAERTWRVVRDVCQRRKSPLHSIRRLARETSAELRGVSAHASRARTSRVHSGALLNAPTLPRVGTRGIIFFRSQLRNSIWDRSVKLSGLYRSGARHASATDLTQYLLANLIVRVENTGFSYASPGPLDPGLIASRSLRGTAPSEDQDETLVQQPACQIPGGTSLRSNSQLVEI